MLRIIREPLIHFLLVGVALFAIYAVLNNSTADRGEDIVVDRAELLEYMQFRHRSFDPERFSRMLDAMTTPEREQLIADYAREEALFREAKMLRLDQHDYVARLRLVQQLEYLTRSSAERDFQPTAEEVRTYFEENKANYYVSPTLTFTHVFINRDGRDSGQLEERLGALQQQLDAQQVRFDQAGSFGDRFLYHLNYIDKTENELEGHFGENMAHQLLDLSVSESWQGPLESPHGYHFVLLARKTPGVMPAFEQVQAKVERDAYDVLLNQRTQQALAEIVERYRIAESSAEPAGAES